MSYTARHAARARWAGKVLIAAALLASGGGVAAGTAMASTPDCTFGNGCATLHGSDAAGHGVAMDAKYQKKTEILIGFPDNNGDTATSFDGVLHFTKGPKSTTYQDTGFTLSPSFTSVPCITGTPHAITPSGNPLTAGTNTLTVQSTTGSVTASPTSGPSINLAGTGSLTVDEQYASDGNSCVAAYHYTVAGGTPTFVSANDAHLIFPTSPGGSTWTFLDSNTGGTFNFTGLPAGVSVSGGSLTANTSTAHPGTYTNVGVTYTATDGAVYTATFTLKISAIKTVNPGPNIPYYTFVFAPHGTWSNQCVTDINGSGALRLTTCTLGKNRYQDFFALDGTVPSQIADSSHTYHFQDWLASDAHGNNSCLTDHSMLNPGTPVSDATDELPTGRQLRVDGDCTASSTLWSWNT